ncbi:ComEC/Rec2 family competence protein [Sphingobium sp. HBC34]|uniref:ComEC/Rec2 family competence protein n=1 Tax=Sphingobium cyanobacteriorum TaxID=3063954 RepID=A0ABT8ZR58_9SPHN|nr:ComEC/Rec2 family competence protein [Sphingobium sp. HBC34]MDO7836185.1 ComEC/Rec2 family competence protein [Sphingobium sp. HBC34]
MAFEPRQTSLGGKAAASAKATLARVEAWLEAEREQIGLWAPIGLSAGIAAWFILPHAMTWLAFCCGALGIACAGAMLPPGGRLRRMIVAGAILACMGCLLVWGKATLLGQPPLARARFVQMTGEVLSVQRVPAQGIVRVRLRPVDAPALPALVRVNIADADMPRGLGEGALIRFRVRLMPPAPPSVPGGYDFAARAYFQGIGATGKALKPVEMLRPSTVAPPLRARLFGHILDKVDGPAEGIAAALATGDQGAIAEADAEAMRRSGLAHLLSISGLHVTALIGAVIFLLMRTMALSQRAALHWPLMLIAAAGGALAGIGYTWLTGAEVPTLRSCIAALLVLGGLAMGRDAITLRLVAAGALLVLFFWPEALTGPSFQMSFAAVTALVALAEHPRFRAFAAARDEGVIGRFGRVLAVTLATGIAVELVLMPIALFHFHKAGVLGAFANLVAIPLTTFVVMPLEALALLLDVVGLGAPAWWLTQQALNLLLLLAHGVAASPMATLLAPTMGMPLFGITVVGLLWCLLWRTGWRWLGLVPVLTGIVATFLASPPDILVTADGRHVAVRTSRGMAILRDRAGDYVRDVLSESAGYDGALTAIAQLPDARCSTDLCALRLKEGGRSWNLLFTRSNVLIGRRDFARDCAAADIVISDRGLPRWCRPRWLKIDRRLLSRTGGLSISLKTGEVHTVHGAGDAHPWIARPGPRRTQL